MNQLHSLTKKLTNLCDRYDPYGWSDYVDEIGGYAAAYNDHEQLIRENDYHLYDFLDEVINEDERPEITEEAKAIRIELLNYSRS